MYCLINTYTAKYNYVMLNIKNTIHKVLHITTDTAFACSVQKQMEKFNIKVEIIGAGKEALKQLKKTDAEIVLLDYDLSEKNDIDLFSYFNTAENSPAFIALISPGEDYAILQALKSGATHYIVKHSGQINVDLLYAIMQNIFTRSCRENDHIRQQQKLNSDKEKDALIANMSHDIRTPMNVIMGISGILSHTKLDAKQKEMLETLSSSTKLLMKLINNLLDINSPRVKNIEVEKEQKKEPKKNPYKLQKNAGEETKGTVLLVEDYQPNVMVATIMLDNLGFQVEVVESGLEALNKIASRNTPYTAILMDVQMPGMDGFETTRRIRLLEKEKGFKNNILGVTAHALAGDKDRCLESGMNDYMSKPIHPDIIARKISALINS